MDENEEKKKLAEEFDKLPDAAPGNAIGEVIEISAASLVGDDTDRPVADNDLDDPGPYVPNSPSPNSPENEQAEIDRRKGAWSEEKKAKGRATRAARRANPNFNDLGGNRASPVPVGPPPRDYYQEALQIFLPTSFFAAKMLGEHWTVAIRQPVRDQDGKIITPGGIDLAPAQTQYVSSMAEWLKYKQFGPMNGDLAFIVASLAYIVPHVKTDPTPEKLKKAWTWIKGKLGFGKGKAK